MRARHFKDEGEDHVLQELAEQGVEIRVLAAAARVFVSEVNLLQSYEATDAEVH